MTAEDLADALTEINFAYMNRQLVTEAALDDRSAQGIASFLVRGMMSRSPPDGNVARLRS